MPIISGMRYNLDLMVHVSIPTPPPAPLVALFIGFTTPLIVISQRIDTHTTIYSVNFCFRWVPF
jgi:hypothetical protein